jgi:hypothetical protein
MYDAKVYQVFIAATDDREIAIPLIWDWNNRYSFNQKVILHLCTKKEDADITVEMGSHDEFEKLLTTQLAIKTGKAVSKAPEPQPATIASFNPVSEKAELLLLAAASSKEGKLHCTQTGGKYLLQADYVELVPEQNNRTKAAYREAVEELITRAFFASNARGTAYSITDEGFKYADELENGKASS